MKRMFIFLAILILISCKHVGDSKLTNRGANLENGMVTSQDTADVLKTYHQSLNIENDSINKLIWAQDARWLQAFGRVFKGRDTIISFTEYLNRSPGYAVSKAGGGYFIVKNSWGRCFGDMGFAYLPYSWVDKWGTEMVAITNVEKV